MTRARSFAPVLVACLALLTTASVALADQLAWIPKRDAERAARALAPGSLFVDWIAHMGDSQPVLYRVVSTRVADVSLAGHAEVQVRAAKVAVGTRNEDGAFAFGTVRGGPPETVAVDLAYCYVPSAEVEGMFVCLGKKLKLECSIGAIAVEVPAATLAALARAGEASTRGLDDSLGDRPAR